MSLIANILPASMRTSMTALYLTMLLMIGGIGTLVAGLVSP